MSFTTTTFRQSMFLILTVCITAFSADALACTDPHAGRSQTVEVNECITITAYKGGCVWSGFSYDVSNSCDRDLSGRVRTIDPDTGASGIMVYDVPANSSATAGGQGFPVVTEEESTEGE